jgi:hypothetical protein
LLGTGAADVRPSAIIPDQLLAGVRDVGTQGGKEIESGRGAGSRRMGTGMAVTILGIIGNLPGMGIVVQSIEGNGRVDAISGQALSRLVVIGRDGLALKH